MLIVGWLSAYFWFANSPIFQKWTNLNLYSYIINYSDFIKLVHFALNQAFMKELPLLSLFTSSNHSIDLFKLLPLLVSSPALGLSLLLSSLNQSPDLILFHIFQVPLFLFVSSSSTSHKHELLCATRWLENTYIPSGTYLFLWIILILFNLISSLFWGINYWHILVLYFITNLFFFLSFAPIPLSSMCIGSHFYSQITFVQIYLYDLVMLTLISISKIHYKSIFWHYSYCCSYHQSCQLFSTHFLLHLPQSLPI